MSDDRKKKLDPKVWMGVCMGAGYVIVMGVKAYAFGWEDVPAFWIWAGVGAIAILTGFAVWSRGRERRKLREAIERSSRRARRAEDEDKQY